MKTKKILCLILSFVLFVSCKEDEPESASIVGKWKGTLAEITVKPFGLPTPISRNDEDFAADLEFKPDGTVVLLQNGQPVEGTYQVTGKALATDIPFVTGLEDITGTFTIEQLTGTNLVVFLEKDNYTFKDPKSGVTVTGDFKVTLHFDRL